LDSLNIILDVEFGICESNKLGYGSLAITFSNLKSFDKKKLLYVL